MSTFKTFKKMALLFALVTMAFAQSGDAQTNRQRLESHISTDNAHVVTLQDYFGDYQVAHSSTPPISYGNENGYSFAHMVDVGAVFQGYQILDADYYPQSGESLIYTLRYLKNTVSDAGMIRLSELGNNNRVEIAFDYTSDSSFIRSIGAAPAPEIIASREDEYTIEHIIKFNGWDGTDKIVIFPGVSATVQSGVNSGFAGTLKVVTVPISIPPHPVIDTPDLEACGTLAQITSTASNLGSQAAGNQLMKMDTAPLFGANDYVNYNSVTGIVSGQSPFETNLIASFVTAGTGNTPAKSYHFRDLANGAGTGDVSGTSGTFGQGSTQTPAMVTIPKDTAFSFDIRSTNSAENQKVQLGSFLRADVCGDLQGIFTDHLSVRGEETQSENTTNFTNVSGVVEYTNPSLEFLTPTVIPGTTPVLISTGIDLTDAHRVEAYITDNDGDQGTTQSVIMRHFRYDDNEGAIFSWHDNDFFRVRINTADIATGDISISAHGVANFTIESLTVYKRAVGVSSRVGEFVPVKSGFKTVDQGYLPVSPGTVTNGATDYPVWASMYPEFVSGSDIVFPDNVADMVIRNVGGNAAAAEGEFQAFATNVDGITVVDPTVTGRQTNRRTGGSNAAYPTTTNVNRSLQGGEVETRMNNRAYQFYAIVDTYHEAVSATGGAVGNFYFSAAFDFASLTSQNVGTQTGLEVLQIPTNHIRWHTGAGITLGQVQAEIPTVSSINVVAADGQSVNPGVPSLAGDAYIFSLNAAQTALTARALN